MKFLMLIQSRYQSLEKDNQLTEKLKKQYYLKKNVKIYSADILKFDLEKSN